MSRATEPGWRVIALHDSTGSRGLWYRASQSIGDPDYYGAPNVLEICSGRCGDDSYIMFNDGNSTSIMRATMQGLFQTAEYAFEQGGKLAPQLISWLVSQDEDVSVSDFESY